jgi:sodium transport system permease protein
MKGGLIRLVLLKELREILRDRRTLLMMIGIPVFLYPGLFVLIEQLMLFGRGNLEAAPPIVAVEIRGGPAPLRLPATDQFRLFPVDRVRHTLVLEGRHDAALVLTPSEGPAGAGVDAQILYDASSERSVLARTTLAAYLERWNDQRLADRLRDLGLPPEFSRPVIVRETSLATPGGLGGAALARFLPLILILMTAFGALNPAIDIAAGERERRTLEPLLSTTAAGADVVVGKFLAVAAVAFTTAALNLASMLLTLRAGIFQFADALGLEFSIPPSAILLTLALLAMLALLFAAVFLGVAIRAQSFREAQAALTPIYLVSFLPAVVIMAPGIEFSVGISLIPVAGLAMLFSALMSGGAVGLAGVTAVVSTIGYAAFALSFATRSFAREDILLGDEESAEVRKQKQRPFWNRGGRALPSPLSAILFVGTIALLYFYFGIGLSRYGERGLLASQWLLLALPTAIYVSYGRFDWRRTLAVRRAPPRAFGAATLIILGALPIGWMIGWLQSFVLPMPEELVASLQGLLTANGTERVLWLLLVVAITPALCEEIVFRGVLFQSLLAKLSPAVAITVSALVFGLFHLSFETAIRLLPTMFLGALLALVVHRTRSILPAMAMHMVNNGVAVILVSWPAAQALVLREDGVPSLALVVVGAVLLAVGIRILPGRTAATPSPPPLDAESVPA